MMNKPTIFVTISGPIGCGKSAVAGEIEIMCKALGLHVEWASGDAEKRLTHADWTEALELYQPLVHIVETSASQPVEVQRVPLTEDTPITWPKARDVGRLDEMHQGGHLRIGLDSDNDVYVSVWSGDGGGSIEFCNPGGGGGGRSSRTRAALIGVMVAMEADNAASPDKDWWALRNGIKPASTEGGAG